MADTVREQVLEDARSIVMNDRNLSYGSPERNFEKIAGLWREYLGGDIEAHDVAVCLMLVKVARITTSPKKLDHWVDIASYAACGAEVRPGDGHVLP